MVAYVRCEFYLNQVFTKKKKEDPKRVAIVL